MAGATVQPASAPALPPEALRYAAHPTSLLRRHVRVQGSKAIHSLGSSLGATLPVPACCRASRLRCSAAAISLPLQTAVPHSETANAPATNGHGNGNGVHPPATAPFPTNGSPSKAETPEGQARIAGSTEAAAVADRFPAVPVLPTPPGSGNLTDVVPYLLTLALQERHLAWRLAAAMSCMMVAKLAGISLPLIFKSAVDALSASGSVTVLVQAALAAVLSYGALDCVRVMAKEAQSPIFAPVSQAVTRRVAYHTFSHVLGLDTRFHLDRRTGRVSRILERGTRSIAVLYRALIFTFLPTGLELLAVGLLLAGRFGPLLAAILGVTFAAYVTWTVAVTQLATDVRKEVNHLDNLTSSKAVDALLNYETVTLFNNQRLEVGLYDKLLCDFRSASLRAEMLAAALNAGQGLILAGGMAAILAAIISSGAATGGDLVMASGLIVQLWAPLQFLGWFYRELRAALVDMEEFFQILRTPSNIQDGDTTLPPAPLMSPPPPPPPAPAAAAAAAEPPPAPAAPATTTTANTTPATSTAAAPSAAAANGTGPEGGRCGHPGVVTEEEERLLEPTRPSSSGWSSANGSSSSSSSSSSANGSTGSSSGSCPDHDEAGSGAGAESESGSESESGLGSRPGVAGLLVELEDVAFGYSPDRQILKGVSLRVAPGESVAVVGSSGSGKSTILKLVTRLYDVWPESGPPAVPTEDPGGGGGGGGGCGTSGAGGRTSGVYVNGVDVRQLRLSELRSAIAVVPQDTALNYDSILENIRYGRPDASDEEVIAAARMARLHDTVMALPDKYDTMVGERGLKLSGGEKQRVAIARAFLRSPRLLVCDEATSALDSATEVAIMESLKELATGRSALFVAHRLSTVRNCDRIVVLRNGEVLEEGSHEQLMERRGEYSAMWELQAHAQNGADLDGGITDSDVETDSAGGGGARPSATVASTDSVDDLGGGVGAIGYGRRAAALAVAAASAAAAVAATAAARAEVEEGRTAAATRRRVQDE